MLNLSEKFKEFAKENAALDPIGVDSRVLLVDSTNLFIRQFSVFPSTDDNGQHIGGIVGFLRSAGMYIRQTKPSRVVFVFDGAGGSQRRRKIHSEYKGNRRSMQRLNRSHDFSTVEDEKLSMKWQMRVIIDLLEHLPVTIIAAEQIEADDTIAYLAELVQERGGKVTIHTTDKDFLQLVNSNCHVYNPVKKKMYDVAAIREEYGIHPNNFLLYRMIDGDKSDNISGVHGVGRKTLLKNFPILVEEQEVTTDMLLHEATLLPSAAAQKLCASDELLAKNHELMCLKDVNISGSTKLKILDQFDLGPRMYNKHALTKLMTQYNLWGPFKQGYDDWLFTSWMALTKYSSQMST